MGGGRGVGAREIKNRNRSPTTRRWTAGGRPRGGSTGPIRAEGRRGDAPPPPRPGLSTRASPLTRRNNSDPTSQGAVGVRVGEGGDGGGVMSGEGAQAGRGRYHRRGLKFYYLVAVSLMSVCFVFHPVYLFVCLFVCLSVVVLL